MKLTVIITVDTLQESTEQIISSVFSGDYDDLPTECVLDKPQIREVFSTELGELLLNAVHGDYATIANTPGLTNPFLEIINRLRTFGIRTDLVKHIAVRQDYRSVRIDLEIPK